MRYDGYNLHMNWHEYVNIKHGYYRVTLHTRRWRRVMEGDLV